jgi:uncharacterized membrane protein affecting hemolysin expression
MAKPRFNRNLVIVLFVAGTIFVATILIVRRWQQNMQSRQEPVATTSMTR